MNQLKNCQARYCSNTGMGRTRTDGPDEFEPSKFDCIYLFFKASLTIRHAATVSQKKSGTSKKNQWDFQISKVGSLDFLNLKVNGSPETTWASKIVSMIGKYHNRKLQTNPWHREEDKQSKQLSLPHLGCLHDNSGDTRHPLFSFLSN